LPGLPAESGFEFAAGSPPSLLAGEAGF